MKVEIVAVGTELLLGQIVDTNSAWIAEQLSAVGLDCHYQTRVGDNHGRIVYVIREALKRNDAVIVCGGLGPTQDDITRDAMAEVMDSTLHLDPDVAEWIRNYFSTSRREMPQNNLRQAMVPRGARIIAQEYGTAPGLICPVGTKVAYLVPGVPSEMKEMIQRAVLPDLLRRTAEPAVIGSRVLRTWGLGESRLAEVVSPRVVALEDSTTTTIAFLASGVEGVKIRITSKASDSDKVQALLQTEEAHLREILGDHVFAVDEQNMESVVGDLMIERGLFLAVAESVTGGLLSSRLVARPGASRFFLGGVVSYATSLKRTVLEVEDSAVISADAAIAMAQGVVKLSGADVGLAITGVAGPEMQEGQPAGTVFVGLCVGAETVAKELHFRGSRDLIRAMATISALDLLRIYLMKSPLI